MPVEKPALIFGDRVMSFTELDERAARCQAAIGRAGAGPDDRVAVMLPNGIEFFEFSLGAARAGCGIVPINWHLKSEEVAWLLQDSGARVLAVHHAFAGTARAALADGTSTALLVVGDGGTADYEAALESVEPAPSPAAPALAPSGPPWPWPDYVYYTSGTTGRPRGVERDRPAADSSRAHAGLAAMWGITGEDVWLASSPLYHAANAYAFTTLSQGGTTVVLERWDAREWMAHVERHRVTACFMVPAHFIRLLEVPAEERARHDLSSLG